MTARLPLAALKEVAAGFDLLRWGHLLHHALSRTEQDRTEVYREGRDNVALFSLVYYARLLGGLYLFEALWSLLLLAPRRLLLGLTGRLAGPDNPIGPLAEKLLSPPTLTTARQDALAIVAWALLVSLMDNVFHYGTPLDQRRFAKDLASPRWASALILHFNLHGTHHLHPALNCWDLPAAHRARGGGTQGRLLPALLNQLRGPIPSSRLAAANGA